MSLGFEVRIGDRGLVYLRPVDDVQDEEAKPIGYDLLEDMEIRRHRRLRRVLRTLIRPQPLYYGCLHWSDGTDLAELDDLVASGSRDAALLRSGLLVEALSIQCRHCQAGLRVMTPSTGDPLVTTELLQQHEFVRDCPVCNLPLGTYVVEFIGRVAGRAPRSRLRRSTVVTVNPSGHE